MPLQERLVRSKYRVKTRQGLIPLHYRKGRKPGAKTKRKVTYRIRARSDKGRLVLWKLRTKTTQGTRIIKREITRKGLFPDRITI
jgi:hypothetical protein